MESTRAVWMYRVLLAGLFVLVILPAFTRKTGDWRTVYVDAAMRLRDGGPLYNGYWPYTYPPFGALGAVPFTYLPDLPFRVVWAAVMAVATGVFLVLAWRLTGGRGLPGRVGTGGGDHAAFWLGGLCAGGFMLDTAANWQTDLVIGAILVGGCVLLARGRGLAAGGAFGVAAAFKCTPLLFAPYLLWKRRFLGALAVLGVAVGVNFLPDVFYPPPDGKPRLVAWKEWYLTPMADRNRDPGLWASAVEYNHSLAGVNLRWMAFERTRVNGQQVSVSRADRASARTLRMLNLGVMGVLGVVALVSLWRRAGEIVPGPVFAAEVGVVLTLMLLLSPMSSKPHFCVLLVPMLAVVRVGFAQRDRVLLALAGLVGVGGLCTGKDIVGRSAYEFLLWNGLIFWMTLALFLGCCHARFWYGGKPATDEHGSKNSPQRHEGHTKGHRGVMN